MSIPALSVEELSVSYGDVRAVDEVSFSVEAGACLAVLGPNGSGKSSLAQALANIVLPSGGSVSYDGVETARVGASVPAYRLARRGVAYIPEGRGIFPGLTVAENVSVGARVVRREMRGDAEDRAYSLFPVLGKRRAQIAGTLSGGEQQMLALARGLVTAPAVLIADELSLGLAPLLIDTIYQALATARAAGVTMVIIEQYVERALALADRALVLRRGRVTWEGPVEAGMHAVVAEYLGGEK